MPNAMDNLGNTEFESSREPITLGPNTLVLLDLDRTLINSNELADTTLLSLEDTLSARRGGSARLTPEEVEAIERDIAAIESVRRQQKKQEGNSFAYLEALQLEMGTTDLAWADQLAEQIIDANREPSGKIKQSFINRIMLPNALELLKGLDRHQTDWLIFTTGEDISQRFKLALLKYILAEQAKIDDVSYLIIKPERDPNLFTGKASMIRQSYDSEASDQPRLDIAKLSGYSSTGSIASQIRTRRYAYAVLFDDKTENVDFDQTAYGVNLTCQLVKADNKDDRPGQTLEYILNERIRWPEQDVDA